MGIPQALKTEVFHLSWFLPSEIFFTHFINLSLKLAIDNISVPKNSVYVTGTVLPFNSYELGCYLPWMKGTVQMWLKDLYTAKKELFLSLSVIV